jgi:tRNA nucleotidyltransferase (CCA-adding enzyme)
MRPDEGQLVSLTGQQFVTHDIVAAFARDRVNLPSAAAQSYRKQVRNLREQLEKKIDLDPDYGLVKMVHSGSVRKGTALRTTSDMDVAVYVRADAAPTGTDADLIPWMEERLKEAYPQLRTEQFEQQDHCVTLAFKSSGLNVDVVPVIYEGADDDFGYLITKGSGARVLTSVPKHIAFITKRKEAHPDDFAQVVRLVKWWVKQLKETNSSFRFKSFMVELVVAHLADIGKIALSDYVTALEDFFDYIVLTGLEERVAFSDNYSPSELPAATGTPIEIFDPVNPGNNVAARYTDANRRAIVEAAAEAADHIAEARFSDTKGRATSLWQTVMGRSFSF